MDPTPAPAWQWVAMGPFKWKREHDNQGGGSKETDVAYKTMWMCVVDDDVMWCSFACDESESLTLNTMDGKW
jgi:hypothetical protein